jgi:ribose 5-phosphate isomerase
MNQEALKKTVALAAIDYIENGSVIGVGSGSTVNCFSSKFRCECREIESVIHSVT